MGDFVVVENLDPFGDFGGDGDSGIKLEDVIGQRVETLEEASSVAVFRNVQYLFRGFLNPVYLEDVRVGEFH